MPILGAAVVTVSLTVVVLTQPVDEIISPYINEPIVPFSDTDIDRQMDISRLFNGMDVSDSVILPDNSIIYVGQTLSNRNVYVPSMHRASKDGGIAWYSFFNPTMEDPEIDYVPLGTSNNRIEKVIYVNPDLIYVIGTIQPKLLDSNNQAYPLADVFAREDIPIGDDLLIFIASFTSSFGNFKIHGFLTPPAEEGIQGTIVADVTLLDQNTLVLTGVTNSHEGLFATAPDKSPFDFVLSVEVNDTLELNHLFTFENSAYIQPTHIQALANGDLIVSGNFEEADGDFADIPLNQLIENPGFVARINGESFTLDWVSSNLLKNTMTPAATQYLNVLELTNHQLVTIANVWEANENNDQAIVLTVFSQTGQIQHQKIIDVGDREAYAVQLFKAITGYWIAGSIMEGDDTNVMLIKLSASFNVESIYEITGSDDDLLLNIPYLQNNGKLMLIIQTYSKDQDYSFLQGQLDPFVVVWVNLG